MEKTVSLSEAKTKLNRLVEDVVERDGEFIITKNGRAVAVLVPAHLYEGWKETKEIQADPEFMKQIKKGVSRLKSRAKRYTFEDIFGEPLK